MGVNQYANAKESTAGSAAGPDGVSQQTRGRQIASYRTSLDDAESDLVLRRLSNIVNVPGERLFAECIDAAGAGATLGEIARAVRIQDHPCEPVTPVCLTRLAASLERH